MTYAAMHIARTGLDAQDMRMRVISNNLANVNTTGFKRDRAAFETLAYQVVTAPGAQSTGETQIRDRPEPRHRRAVQGTARIDTQGSMQTTGNSLDMAIDGDGYFQVQLPGGTLGYTRAGNFSRSPEGLLVTSEGYQVMPGITVSGKRHDDHDRQRRHRVRDVPGQAEASQLGQIQVAELPECRRPAIDRRQLPDRDRGERRGQSRHRRVEDGRGRVRQGMLEASNVNVVEELVDMIETQRAYEVNSKMISGDRRHAQIRQPEPVRRRIVTSAHRTVRLHWIEVALAAASGLLVLAAAAPSPAHAGLFGKKKPPEDFTAVRPAPLPLPVPVAAPANGAIFQVSSGYAALYEGWRARRVGDPLTIVLVERTAASKSANSQARLVWRGQHYAAEHRACSTCSRRPTRPPATIAISRAAALPTRPIRCRAKSASRWPKSTPTARCWCRGRSASR